MQIRARDLYDLHDNFIYLSAHFPGNSLRKNYFLAACFLFYPEVDLDQVNLNCQYGGKIGIGDSYMHDYLSGSKILRLHAILHDAAGYVKTHYGMGPGYSYVIRFPGNSCFIGHVTGLTFCMYMKIIQRTIFHLLEC